VNFINSFNTFHSQPENGFVRLTKLNSLTFATEIDVFVPFELLQLFINHCCPNETILKKLDRIPLSNEIWSKINQYKDTYDSLNLYICFIYDKSLTSITFKSDNDHLCFIETSEMIDDDDDDILSSLHTLRFQLNCPNTSSIRL